MFFADLIPYACLNPKESEDDDSIIDVKIIKKKRNFDDDTEEVKTDDLPDIDYAFFTLNFPLQGLENNTKNEKKEVNEDQL